MHDVNGIEIPMQMRGTTAPVKMWLPEWEIESSALSQLRNIAELPWVHGLRVMPDCHFGKGATVGSVIAMRGAVSPAAVGVDIGCLDAETEFLSPDGWVRMSEWSGQDVLIYDPASDRTRFSKPERYIDLPCDEFWHFKNSKGMDQMVSEEHRMLVFRGHKSRGMKAGVMRPEELAGKDLSKGYYCTKSSFLSGMPDVDILDEMIRVEAMIQADGRVRHGHDASRVEVHLRRPRKIDRAQLLLTEAGIDFGVSVLGDGSTLIGFSIDPEYASKTLSRYWTASERQLRILADESLLWDGHDGYRPNFSSTDKGSIDVIQYAFAATGRRAGLCNVGRQKDHHRDVYMVNPTRNEMVGYCDPIVVPSPGARKYCFTVSTGFFVARRNGKIFTTGNCGVAAVRTNLVEDDLEDLHALRSAIESAIPVGFHEHADPVTNRRLSDLGVRGGWDTFWSGFETLPDKVQDRAGKARRQMGSMGGGNHFAELCVDERDGRVWLTLHSGSRNIGKEIAEVHISAAKGLDYNQALPDRDLAVFLADTPGMDAYVADVHWAQEYAARSREVMLALFRHEVSEHWSGRGKVVEFDSSVNCHHNYISVEEIDGETMVVTRKGAISTRDGGLSLIPGSMGTGSFVVRGLSNPDSFYSASHGAGRKMSRGAAKRHFTVDDLAAQTAGVECRKDQGVVDEIPGAYKDIRSVMQYQSDLVEPVAHLRTVLCVKG